MSVTQQARLSELDAALDSVTPSSALADELFALADLIDAQPSLRRALTDPGLEDAQRQGLVDSLFANRVSSEARAVLSRAVGLRWGTASGLSAALDRQGSRALFAAAQSGDRLDTVEDDLFRFGRVVAGDRALSSAIADRSAPLAARQQLVSDVLGGRVDEITESVLRRSVAARKRTFELTLEDYLVSAAAQRNRAIAKVVVARPLTADQESRLAVALSKQLGKSITLQVTVDPDVLGGVRVTVGDEVIEGTVSGRLTDAARQLS